MTGSSLTGGVLALLRTGLRAGPRAGHVERPPAPVADRRCATCAHFDNRAATVEAALPGLASFGSAASAVRSRDGLCALRGLYLADDRCCASHAERARARSPG